MTKAPGIVKVGLGRWPLMLALLAGGVHAAPTRFDQVRVREAVAIGQRVEGWALEAKVDGAWKTLSEGTTVGVRHILRFAPVTASKVRLRVTKARACPAIAEVALFLSAPLP